MRKKEESPKKKIKKDEKEEEPKGISSIETFKDSNFRRILISESKQKKKLNKNSSMKYEKGFRNYEYRTTLTIPTYLIFLKDGFLIDLNQKLHF